MAGGSSASWGKISKVSVYNPAKEMVTSLRKKVDIAFRPPWDRLPVTNDIESCCFLSSGMKDYVQEYHEFLTNPKWQWKLLSSTRIDLSRAWTRLTDFEFWAVEDSDNIGRTYVFRFDNCAFGQQQNIEIGNPAELLRGGKTFRDGDLCYCFKEEPHCLLVNELFYLETLNGKRGFVLYGTHTWVSANVNAWKKTISNVVGVYYFHEQPGTMKVYK